MLMKQPNECPQCDRINIDTIENKDGTKEFVCLECGCRYVPSWLMDENIRVLRRKFKEKNK